MENNYDIVRKIHELDQNVATEGDVRNLTQYTSSLYESPFARMAARYKISSIVKKMKPESKKRCITFFLDTFCPAAKDSWLQRNTLEMIHESGGEDAWECLSHALESCDVHHLVKRRGISLLSKSV